MAADTRLLSLASTLPAGALIPTRLSVIENLGEPYAIELDVLGESADLLPKDLLTKPIAVTVRQPMAGGPVIRHFHGLVVEWQRLGPGAAGCTAYRLVAVPGLWRLGLRENCRVFQDKSVKDIVTHGAVGARAAGADVGHPADSELDPYCTQFNETDLAFVSRLLEEHGLTYYFSHTASSHL
jgi:type VI secretion system secreted protein VgrG